MRFEFVSIKEFDERAERVRIERNFKGRQRERLLWLLERLGTDDFDGLLQGFTEFDRTLAPFCHPVVEEVVRNLLLRDQLLKSAAAAQRALDRQRADPAGPRTAVLGDLEGTPKRIEDVLPIVRLVPSR